MSSDSTEKAGGRVGIVGTGHRARVCPVFSCFSSFVSFTSHSHLHLSLPTFSPSFDARHIVS